MKRFLLVGFLATFFISFLPGFEIEVSSQVENLYWAPTRANDTAGKTFSGSDYFWNYDVSVTQDLSEGIRFKSSFLTDPILRRRINAEIGLTSGNFNIKFNPFLGLINTVPKWFNPGLEASLLYTFPGFGFLRGGFSTTFAPLSKIGDYYTTSQYASGGILMENGIITFEISDRSFTERKGSSNDITDQLTRYYLDTEMFIKNFPLRWSIGFGYQILDRIYVDTSQSETLVHSCLIGGKITWEINPQFTVYGQLENSLFTLGLGNTVYNVSSSTYLFSAKTGLIYKF